MSVVTGVTIITNCCNESLDTLIQRINEWIVDDPPCGGGRLFQVDQYYGGGKHPECLVWGGGFNYLSWSKLIDFVKGLPWKDYFNVEEDRVILVISPDQRPMEVHIVS